MPYILLTGVTASVVLSSLGLGILLYVGRSGRKSPYWFPIFLWVLHTFVFYTTNLIFRLVDGYTGPSHFFSLWSMLVSIQAVLSVIGVSIVKERMDDG